MKKRAKKLTQAQKIDAIYAALCGATIVIEHPRAKQKYQRIGNIEVYDKNMSVMTYVDAVKAVPEGWRIPTLEELRLMYKNKDSVSGEPYMTICSDSDFPQWYWSCTEHRDDPSYVWFADFSDGYGDWDHKDCLRLSCRPVRLVPAAG